MGSGIAQLLVQEGLDVVLYDIAPAALRSGLERIRQGLEKAGRRELLPRVEPTDSIEAAASADMAIEAAYEDLEVKRALLRRLGELLPPPRVIATNTSSLSVRELASAAPAPERVLGMHFFNPATLMRLVEVIPHPGTSEPARKAVLELARRLGKTAVVSADAPGFIANRLVRPFYLRPLEMAARGDAAPGVLDEVFRRRGFRMGPFQLMDLIGLDVNLAITRVLHRGLGERFRPSSLQESLVARGALGRKSGAGFYLYGPDGKASGENPMLKELGVPPRPRVWVDTEVLFRQVILDVATEAGRLVEEKVATQEDIETAMRLGLHWPKGPLEWAKELAV